MQQHKVLQPFFGGKAKCSDRFFAGAEEDGGARTSGFGGDGA
jgi:hypothetical protein